MKQDCRKVIQSVMGHSDITTTMDIYAEVTEEKKQEIMANLRGKIIIYIIIKKGIPAEFFSRDFLREKNFKNNQM